MGTKRGEIEHELGVHGTTWSHVHGGYFSDPAIAGEFISVVKSVVDAHAPRIVVDLGGGTGYLLNELARCCPDPDLRFINMDLSEKQLALIANPRITPFLGSVADLDRAKINPGSHRVLFVMRSVLHYFGQAGLLPALRHIRSQMRPGEFFIHQTVDFDSPTACQCLNVLYEQMGTGKWYPTADELDKMLRESGWEIRSRRSAPSLPLDSLELANRYGFGEQDARRIEEMILSRFGEMPNVFVRTSQGFCAYLPYTIYTCAAV